MIKLAQYIKENWDRKFEWGVFDCCTFACDVIVIKGGVDFAADVRGKYSTELGSKRILHRHFGTMEEAFSSLTPVYSVNYVQRGDIAIFDKLDGQECMSVYWTDGWLVVSENQGLGYLKDDIEPRKIWRVK